VKEKRIFDLKGRGPPLEARVGLGDRQEGRQEARSQASVSKAMSLKRSDISTLP